MNPNSGPTSIIALAAVLGLAGCPNPAPPKCTGALCDPITVGTSPNDAVLTSCLGDPVAVVAESADARLDTFDVPSGKLVASISFPVVNAHAANPFAVAVDETHGVAVVTLNEQDGLALVDPCTGEIFSSSAVNGASKPQPVVFDGARFIVGFTNVINVGTGTDDPPVLDPGVVAAFTVDGHTMSPGPAVTLPCKNPQGLVVDGEDVWVACTGPIGPDGANRERALEDGAFVRLSGPNLDVTATIDAARLAPGTPALFGDEAHRTLVAGSIVTPDIISAAVDGSGTVTVTHVDGPEVDSLFKTSVWDANTALISQFSKDGIIVVDVTDPAAPVVGADNGFIGIAPDGSPLRGLVALDVRPGFGDVDAIALFTLSSEVIPLQLHEVLP